MVGLTKLLFHHLIKNHTLRALVLRILVELVATHVLQLHQSTVDRLHVEGRHVHLVWTWILGVAIGRLVDLPARILQRIHRRTVLQGAELEVVLLLGLLLEEPYVLIVLYHLTLSEGRRLLFLNHFMLFGRRTHVNIPVLHSRIEIIMFELVYLNVWITQIRITLAQWKGRYIVHSQAEALLWCANIVVRHVGWLWWPLLILWDELLLFCNWGRSLVEYIGEFLNSWRHRLGILLDFIFMNFLAATGPRQLLDLDFQFTDHILVYFQIISRWNGWSQDAFANRALQSTLRRQENALCPELLAVRTQLYRLLYTFMAEGVLAARHFAWHMVLPVELLKAYKAAQVLLLKRSALLLDLRLHARALVHAVVRRQKKVLQVVTHRRCQIHVICVQIGVHRVSCFAAEFIW